MLRRTCIVVLLSCSGAGAFSPVAHAKRTRRVDLQRVAAPVAMGNEEGKGAIGGAVLGGLLAGPFGALWGAQIGGAVGANNRAKREQTEALDAMGLSEDVLQAAKAVAMELEEAEASLSIVRGAEDSQRALIKMHERASEEAYAAAEVALRSGDEAAARSLLEQRQSSKAKQAVAEADLAAATRRVADMQANVAAIAERAAAVEQKIAGTVASARDATKRGGAPRGGDSLDLEDPLERRFRELE